jgi:predicted membrane protein DUF2142
VADPPYLKANVPTPEAESLEREPPARPLLRPVLRWARWALIFLLAFTFLRGAVWAMTFPSFFGPDEDYHFLYAEYLTTQHALPDPKKPLYPDEYPALLTAMRYESYCCGPPGDFSGDPKRSVRSMENRPEAYREPSHYGRGVGVVHPPLYQSAAAVVNWALGDRSVFTRYAAIKWLSSLFGVLAVYAAWLLASQVFRNEALRLLVALLAAVQPVIGLLSGIVNHDILVVATFTLACALMLFVLRTAPRARQGAWLGGAIVLALLTKGTALALLPLAALAYGAQAFVYRDRWREAARSAAVAGAVVLAGAGWWYAYVRLKYGDVTGATTSIGGHAKQPVTLDTIWTLTKSWTGYTYRTYWYHHFIYEAPRSWILYYLPAFVGAAGMGGLAMLGVRRRRELFSPEHPLLRQVAFLTIAALALYVPILTVDIRHFINGDGFQMTGGRYLVPAYAGVATLLVVGLREIVRDRAQPAVFAGLAALAAWFGWSVYVRLYAHRYYGDSKTSWRETFHRMSFDRPEFVTATTLRIAMALTFLTLASAAIAVVVGNLPPGARARLRRGAARRRLAASQG